MAEAAWTIVLSKLEQVLSFVCVYFALLRIYCNHCVFLTGEISSASGSARIVLDETEVLVVIKVGQFFDIIFLLYFL